MVVILPTKRIKLLDIGLHGNSAGNSDYVCVVGGDAGVGGCGYDYSSVGVRPVVSIPASGAPAGLKTALGINN